MLKVPWWAARRIPETTSNETSIIAGKSMISSKTFFRFFYSAQKYV